MLCPKCGAQLPQEALFCMRCGSSVSPSPKATSSEGAAPQRQVIAPNGVTVLKCPSCGAPIEPKFGEMVVTCEYCETSVVLGSEGWRSIQKHTMLPLGFGDRDAILKRMHDMMIVGLLKRHLQDSSTLEELTLAIVPFWVIPVSARTMIVASDAAVQAGNIVTTAALMGVMGAAMGDRRGRGGFAGPILTGAMLGTAMGGRQAGGATKAYQMNSIYQFPVVGLRALSQYQPRDYVFDVDDRTLFDASKFPKGIKVMNGDVGEDDAKYQARALVDQIQADKAHSQYHMIQQIKTEMDISDGELLHVPIWLARYNRKGKTIVLLVDGHNGSLINSIGLKQ